MIRAGIVLFSADGIAVIERVRDGLTYYVLPGGQVDPGETVAEAARRETLEELGLHVRILGTVAVVNFRDSNQHYFLAEALGGEFGTGDGPEMDSPVDSEAGSYRAMWLPPARYGELKPKPIGAALAAVPDPEALANEWLDTPMVFDEPG
ncbi:NUDIX domain-containing protein [Kribbella sp. NPDC051587]|uniref:NUDIX domain-containing protein n=1 Tax=Kribbella sp. NPDC051587 TaxID=3364119 RepID=UPI0037B7D138